MDNFKKDIFSYINMILEELVLVGFEIEEAQKLAESNDFHHRRKTHQELINLFNKISGVYGFTFEEVKKAILSFPQFAGYDHERVVRQKTRLGRMAGLTNKEIIDYLLYIPVLAGYSAKRYLAAFDIGRQLEREGFPQDERMLNSFLIYYSKSPYVPDTKRKRISQIPNGKEPPLLKAMRKRLMKK